MTNSDDNEELHAALTYVKAGLSVIPVKPDKRPAIPEWKSYQERIPSENDIRTWFGTGRHRGLAILGGQVSGGLFVLDFDADADEVFPAWLEYVHRNTGLPVDTWPVVRTGKGFHLYLRTDNPPRNTKLAMSAAGGVLIETRGEGGYVVAPPSIHPNPQPWPLGRPYCVHQGELTTIPRLDETELAFILSAAAFFDERPQVDEPPAVASQPVATLATMAAGAGGRGLERYVAKVWSSQLTRVSSALEGTRNETLFIAAKELAKLASAGLVAEHDIEPALRTAAASYIAADGEKAFSATVASGLAAGKAAQWTPPTPRVSQNGHRTNGVNGSAAIGQAEPPAAASRPAEPLAADETPSAASDSELAEYMRTDTGNAERLVARHGHNLRFVAEWNSWLAWNGQVWQKDTGGRIMRMAKDTVRNIYREAATIEDETRRKELAGHAAKSESRNRILSMVELAKSEPAVAIDAAELDSNPWLLAVRNGVIDLATGQLLTHSRNYHLMRMVDVDYLPAAECPHWLAFLDTIFAADSSLIAFIQRAAGYTLTGDTSEQCFFYMHGHGRNGKSTFANTLAAACGGYYQKLSTESLMAKNYTTVPADIAALPGARLAVAAEVESGHRLAESLVKDITGGDDIRARFMHQNWFTFRPAAKVWIYGNHKVDIRGTDEGIWRRVRMIPFNVQIPAEQVDKRLGDKLRGELPGILAWMVAGCLAWQREGLGQPAAVESATKAYREEQDILAEFLNEACDIEGKATENATDVFTAFRQWCKVNGEKAYTQTFFGRMLRERGFDKERTTGGRKVYRGLRLNDTGHEFMDSWDSAS